MKTLGNLFWLFGGGFLLFLLWSVAGLFCCLTVVAIPAGLQCFKFAGFLLWPFGRRLIYAGGAGSSIANVLWILLLGWELAFFSLIVGLVYCCTILGIPFGIQSFKFARLALFPFGTRVI